jgi:hypothetical protein
MSSQPSETMMRSSRNSGEEWQGRSSPAQWEPRPSGLPSGWLITGLTVLGLGALAWYYLGPDLRRYLKIRSM